MLEVIDGRAGAAPVHVPRPVPVARLSEEVAATVERVRLQGDAALARPGRVEDERVAAARALVPPDALEALEALASRLRRTCERQRLHSWVERGDDEVVGELVRPLRRVGVCASRPSRVLMAAVPAAVAGVSGIAAACPPGPAGEVSDAVLAACAIGGVDEVYPIGGAEAVAALAYGTESVRPVDKVIGDRDGPGAVALGMVAGWVGTFAVGPGETAIVADATASPAAIAGDLVAHAEQGPGGTHALVTWVPEVVEGVLAAVEVAAARHVRGDEVENALTEGGRAVLVRDEGHALDTVEAFAPERVALACVGAERMIERVRSTGAAFLGASTPPAVSDYDGAVDALLPTGGAARWSSGLGVRDFTTTIYVRGLVPRALEALSGNVDALARLEGLPGHALALAERLDR